MRSHWFVSAAAAAGLALAGHALAQANAACDADCMAVFQAQLAKEKANYATPDFASDPFYTTPANFSGAQPGDILRWQEISAEGMLANFTSVFSGMSLTRVMYVTEDIDRKPIPATAFVLLPLSLPACGKFKTIAWAHGTAGRSRHCAPSNQKDLYYGWEAPLLYAANGYAVIATDYAGQGSDVPGGFKYEAGHIHAADIAYALIAAKKVLGSILSEQWVVVGHSEGGMTAWRTNQRLAMPDQDALKKAGDFIGAVSIAPALSPLDLIPKSFKLAGDKPNGPALNAVYFLQSLTEIYPNDIRLPDILTQRALDLIPLLNDGCQFSDQVLFTNLTTKDVFKDQSWLQKPQLRDWMERFNGVDTRPLAVPMLVVQGDNDQLTYLENCMESFNRTCGADPRANVELRVYPDLGHGGALDASQPYVLQWLGQRFAGKQSPQGGCRVNKVVAINNRYQRDLIPA